MEWRGREGKRELVFQKALGGNWKEVTSGSRGGKRRNICRGKLSCKRGKKGTEVWLNSPESLGLEKTAVSSGEGRQQYLKRGGGELLLNLHRPSVRQLENVDQNGKRGEKLIEV